MIVETTIGPPAARLMSSLRYLRQTLLLDAVASGALGLVMALAATPLGDMFGLPIGLLRWTGSGLILFAVVVAYLGSRQQASRSAALAVIAVNLFWVAGSLLLLGFGRIEPTALGGAFILIQALAVALFTGLQIVGLRRVVPAAP